ncbi:MAG: hypothetical protein ABL901_03175 [Hyphomicrobiaceae bacterium]
METNTTPDTKATQPAEAELFLYAVNLRSIAHHTIRVKAEDALDARELAIAQWTADPAKFEPELVEFDGACAFAVPVARSAAQPASTVIAPVPPPSESGPPAIKRFRINVADTRYYFYLIDAVSEEAADEIARERHEAGDEGTEYSADYGEFLDIFEVDRDEVQQ